METWLNQNVEKTKKANFIDKEYYNKYDIKRGLRNSDGTGVVVGFTKLGSVIGYEYINGKKVPAEGKLFYRDRSIVELTSDYSKFGFERAVYLLLFGELPSKKDLDMFNELLDMYRDLPNGFTENMILKIPSTDIMNKIQRSVLVLYSHDDNPDSLDIEKVIMQSIRLIARFPTIMAYGYQAKAHYFDNKSLYIHSPQNGIGTARNILHMIRNDNKYTKLEAETLELLLILHLEHGGGNNSTFVTHVVSSSGTDTYSVISAAVGCLKGPKHGGANKKVKLMISDIKKNTDYTNKNELKKYLIKILNGETANEKNLIYGMGHAVYTKSDPRAEILKVKAKELAKSNNMMTEYQLYCDIEEITKRIFKEMKGQDKEICANIDLYSGFVYELLNIPEDLFTPIFAVARVGSWCSHRIEQLMSDKKIIRPAYMSIND
ncbi:MAG: citrate synthase [Bacillota bacterium]|nr:citrate synthase [Bacillota bacterium]